MHIGEMENMPNSENKLLQVRLSEAERRQIKTLAAMQGMTLREATLQAFSAWAEKLQSRAAPPRGGANLAKPK